MPDLLAVPPHRLDAIRGVLGALTDARTVALSTHVNADGDGCGSEAALARLLRASGKNVRIVNPTPWPQAFEYLLGPDIIEATALGARALGQIDLLAVVDI